jgi:hypothetical protein
MYVCTYKTYNFKDFVRTCILQCNFRCILMYEKKFKVFLFTGEILPCDRRAYILKEIDMHAPRARS